MPHKGLVDDWKDIFDNTSRFSRALFVNFELSVSLPQLSAHILDISAFTATAIGESCVCHKVVYLALSGQVPSNNSAPKKGHGTMNRSLAGTT